MYAYLIQKITISEQAPFEAYNRVKILHGDYIDNYFKTEITISLILN